MREWGPTFLRLALGGVFLAHGAQKLFGVWDGPGLAGASQYLTSLGLPVPYLLAILVALAETGGGLLIVLGAYARWIAPLLIVEMGVGIWKVHYAHGFFLNWSLTPGVGHGSEFNLLIIGGLLCLIFTGPGMLSVDYARQRAAEEEASGLARLRAKVNT
jgi:putative oxidoreductase